jgi:hypothetical protein
MARKRKPTPFGAARAQAYIILDEDDQLWKSGLIFPNAYEAETYFKTRNESAGRSSEGLHVALCEIMVVMPSHKKELAATGLLNKFYKFVYRIVWTWWMSGYVAAGRKKR